MGKLKRIGALLKPKPAAAAAANNSVQSSAPQRNSGNTQPQSVLRRSPRLSAEPERVPNYPDMDEEDDDMYAPAEPVADESTANAGASGARPSGANGDQAMREDDDEDDDDSDEEDDSDDEIEIITERKPNEPTEPLSHNTRPASAAVKIEAPPSASIPQTSAPQNNGPGSTPAPGPGQIGRLASPGPGRPGSSYPEVKTSTLDLNGNPMLPSTGKPILNTDMDADFQADAAPWRRPGSDMTDYYNYGFDEGTWAAYCIKQRQMRGEIQEDRKRMEQLGAMMGGSMPFGMMGGMDASGAAGMPMPNMEQMQQMMGMMGGGMPGMPGMDGGMGQGQNAGYQNQGGYGGGRNQGGRGKRW